MRNYKSLGKSLLQGFSSSYFRGGVGIFVSGMVLVYLFRNIDLRETWAVLRKTQLGFVGIGLLSVGVSNICKVLRWKVLLGTTGREIGFASLLGAVLSGQLLNALIPGRVGDFARAFMVGEEGGRLFILGTIALEKLIEMLAFAILFLSLLFFVPFPTWMDVPLLSLSLLVIVGSLTLAGVVYYYEAFTAFLFRLCRYFPARFHQWFIPRLQASLVSLQVLGRGKNLVWVMVLTMLVWSNAVLVNYVGMRAVGISLPISVSIILLLGLQTGIVVSASPGAVGVFEAICVFTLVYFGVERSLALGYSLLLHALVLIPPMIGGIFSMLGWGFRLPSSS